MIGRFITQLEWTYNTPLTNGQNLSVPLGAENNPFVVGKGQDVRFMTFGVFSSHTFTIFVEQSWRGDFGADVNVIATLAVLAGVYTQPFALPAPQGDKGYFVVQGDYLRCRAVDTAAANHTRTNLYFAAWSP